MKSGYWYTWQQDDSLEKISQKTGVTKEKIRKENNIFNPDDLVAGMQLWISSPQKEGYDTKPEKHLPEKAHSGKMLWPSQGTISSGYGMRHGKMHTGLDITRDRGYKIKAALGGRVEFAGWQNGYGRTIILNHGGGLKTLYGHNSKLFVRKGMRVKRGAVIAKMGSTGRSSGIHLHFEVQRKGKHVNPLRYLPIR